MKLYVVFDRRACEPVDLLFEEPTVTGTLAVHEFDVLTPVSITDHDSFKSIDTPSGVFVCTDVEIDGLDITMSDRHAGTVGVLTKCSKV